MALIRESDKRILEKLFGMHSGYVLDFSNATFQSFFESNFNIDIEAAKYCSNGSSKAKRLRSFFELESEELVGKVILELIEVSKSINIINDVVEAEAELLLQKKAEEVGERMLGKQSLNATSVDEFLKKEYQNISLERLSIDNQVIEVLKKRLVEVGNCIESNSPLSCVILCGSVLEGVLLGVASSNMKEFNQCESSPKHRETGKVLMFNEWSLASLIDVAYKIGLLGLDVKEYSHSLRSFRNYIHPYEQMVSGFDPDIETAKISYQVLKAAISDLSNEV